MDTEIITTVIQIVFMVTALLALVNLLKNLSEIPILRFLLIREDHLNKLFKLLILEVVIGVTPIAINALVQNFIEYTYDDDYVITSNISKIYYKRPFKSIPSVKITSGQDYPEVFLIQEHSNDKFVVDARGFTGDFKIRFTVTGVPEN